MAGGRHTGGRRLRRTLTLLLVLASAGAAAQGLDPRDSRHALIEDGSLPPYVVPVLRLVSSTHVEPATGLVVSASGLVLVPLGFASEGDEVVVLDGGTDIVRNGRTAHLRDYFPAEGLQVLSVPGLQRRAAPFADESLADGARVELTAFPPAERIAAGDPPLHAPATVVVIGARGDPAVSGETPLPNVTGPLLDECGNVAAYSLAHDVQSMASHPGTRYQWRRTLLAVLGRLGVAPEPSACGALESIAAAQPPGEPAATEAEPATPTETAAPEPQAEPPTEAPPAMPDEAAADGAAEAPKAAEAAEAGPAAPRDEPLDLERLPPHEPAARPSWLWLLAGLLLIVGGLWAHVRRRRRSQQAPGAVAGAAADPVAGGAGAAVSAHLDRRLVLRGALSDGTPVAAGCAVSSRAINLVAGRGETADLVIPGVAVSRRHARLNGTASALTVADLGSNNGTSVNGVPCLEGEILYLEPGDALVLGDAQLTVVFEALDEPAR